MSRSRPIVHSRLLEFEGVFERVRSGLALFSETNSEVIVLAASGTGAMEAAVVNLCSPGDLAIVVRCGKFGERWADICRAFGVTVHALEAPYGDTVRAERLADALSTHPEARAVFAT